MRKSLIVILLLLHAHAFTQTKGIDSLYWKLKNVQNDTNKVKILNTLAQKIASINPNLSFEYAIKAKVLASTLNYKIGEITALCNIGMVYYNRGEYPKALSNFLVAEKILENYPNTILLSDVYNNIALVYVNTNKKNVAYTYFDRTIKLNKESNNYKGLGDSYNNLGYIYSERNEIEKAKSFFEQSLKFRLISNDIEKIPVTLSNLGNTNIRLKNLSTATRQINQALILFLKSEDIIGQSMIYNQIGDLKFQQNKKVEALDYFLKSLEISKKYNIQSYMQHSYEKLAILYEENKEYEKANTCLKENTIIKDRIYNTENSKQLAEMQTKYESEKKQRELLKRNSEIERKNIQINLFRIGFVLIIILVIYIIYNLRDKLKINKIITKQKQAVELQNKIIEEKNLLVEAQNKDIKDSIQYAKRIQNAILPPKEYWMEILPDSFVIYQPKDILSGDFYWIAETATHRYIACADCTGHGVPGALISVINYNLLNKAVLEKGLVETGEILDAVNEWLTESLHQKAENSTVKDGMDVCLISINKETDELNFSGAYNSLYVVNDEEMIQYKGDKFPVGSFLDEQINHFSTQQIRVKKGDHLYMFTDGFPDQFGGDQGKKYKHKKLKEDILAIYKYDLEYQRNYILKSFKEWKGNYEQVDDVLFLGIRI